MNKEYALEVVRQRTTSRQRRIIQYLLVGIVGILINEGTLLIVTGGLGVTYIVGGFLGQVTSISVNYAINDAWTWKQYGKSGIQSWIYRGIKYASTRVVGVGIHLIALGLFVEVFHIHYLIANLLAIGVGSAWGFGASDIWVWNTDTATKSYIGQFETRVRENITALDTKTKYVFVFAGVLFVFYAIFTILLYHSYWITGGDFGSYVHAFETTKEGSAFLHTGRYRIGNPSSAYWGEHFSATLFLIYPIYLLFPTPETLFIVKSVLISCSIPVLWFLARQQLSDRLALLVVLSYSFNPFLIAAWIFDFQEQIFLPVLLFGTYYCYRSRRYFGFLVLIALTLLTNEFLVIIMFGALIGFTILAARTPERSLKRESPVFAGAFLLLIGVHLLSGHIIGQYNEFSGIPTVALAEPIRPFIESQRVSVGGLITLLLEKPMLVWDSFTKQIMSKTVYLVMFFVPVGFLALFDELSLTALAPFVGFAWLFAGPSVYYTFGAHYPLYLLPFLYIGAIRAYSKFEFSQDSKALLTKLFVAILVLNTMGTISVGIETEAFPERTEHMDTLDKAVDSIPHEASLVTQNEIYPHVATRPNALFVASEGQYHRYRGLYDVDKPRYILFDTEISSRPENWAEEIQGAYQSELGANYGLYQYEDGIWIFKRGYDGRLRGITSPYVQPNHTFSAEALKYQSASLFDQKIVSRSGNIGDYVWFGPYVSLPPGNYTATYLVKTRTNTTGTQPTVQLDVTPGDKTPIATKTINQTDGWKQINLTFSLDSYESDIEFRGRREVRNGTIAVREIYIR